VKNIAVLFDLDGTLVNSKPAVERAWIQLAQEASIPLEKMSGLHGIPAEQSLRKILPDRSESEIIKWVERIEYLESSDTNGVIAIDGAIDLLAKLDEKKISWTIVTSCTTPLALSRVKAAGIPFPENSVTFNDVEKGKPFPDPFLLGAKRLGVNPKDCVVVEDAPAGVIAGKAAGCVVAAVLTSHEKHELKMADHHLEHLNQLLPIIL
jgi:sugar-phosphatase